MVLTPGLTSSVAAYRDGLGWRVRQRGRLAPRTARAWGAPALAGAPTALVGPASRLGGDVRFIQAEVRPAVPLRDAGWAALEMCVADLDGALTRAADHFIVIGRPVR